MIFPSRLIKIWVVTIFPCRCVSLCQLFRVWFVWDQLAVIAWKQIHFLDQPNSSLFIARSNLYWCPRNTVPKDIFLTFYLSSWKSSSLCACHVVIYLKHIVRNVAELMGQPLHYIYAVILTTSKYKPILEKSIISAVRIMFVCLQGIGAADANARHSCPVLQPCMAVCRFLRRRKRMRRYPPPLAEARKPEKKKKRSLSGPTFSMLRWRFRTECVLRSTAVSLCVLFYLSLTLRCCYLDSWK